MKLNKILFGTIMIATVGLMFSCSSDDDKGGGGNNNQGEREVEVKGEMKKAELLGFVKDVDGNALAGVKVGSGTAVTTTDASGAFALTDIEVVKGRTVVDFTKDGYFDVVRSFDQASKDKWEVVMVSRTNSSISTNATYSASSAKTLATADGMQVKMPADGYKDAKTGKDYNGTVQTEMLYLNPDDDNFADMMPGGDLAAVDANDKTVQLVSYGMTKVEMKDNAGNALQLKDGKEAQLTFPIPESLKDKTPNQIPLWSFNESTGLWEEEGIATLQNGVYVGTVKHFSWVNLDWPETRVTVNIKVKTTTGKVVPWTLIHVGQTTCVSNAQGEAQCYIPENTDVKIWVESEDYGNYSPVVSVNVHGQAGATTINQTITLPDLPHITGKIVNKEGSALSTVWITYGGNETKYYHTDFDGKFSIMSPLDYKGPATLKIRASNGEYFSKSFTITGQDVDLGDIDINAKIDPTKTQGGIVHVNTDNNKSYDLPIVITKESLSSGATIIDNSFWIGNYEDEQNIDWDDPNFERTHFSFGSENYDRTKGTATGYFYYMLESQTKHTMAEVENANFEIQIKDKKITLNMNGRGVFRDETPGGEWEDIDWEKGNAAFIGSGLTFNIVMMGETHKPFTKNYAPSFMPYIGNEYPVGIVCNSTYFNLGAQAFTGGTMDDFNRLVAIADQSLTQANGWVKVVEDVGEGSGLNEEGEVTRYAEIAYYNATDGNIVVIEFDPWSKWSDDTLNNISSAYNIDAPITVYAYQGLTIAPTNFYNENVPKAKKRAKANQSLMQKIQKAIRK